VTLSGGFSEYVVLSVHFCVISVGGINCFSSDASKVYKIQNLTDEEATLVEPAACAIHGLDKLAAPVGIEVLIIGAGPTGLILAQLLKLNGAFRVVIAANKGIKTKIAKELEAGHEYLELDRQNPQAQWETLKQENPHGFDVVVRAIICHLT
jgi:D-arabinitol dehydrogenase (NADP+)